jgi:hypothetical protein
LSVIFTPRVTKKNPGNYARAINFYRLSSIKKTQKALKHAFAFDHRNACFDDEEYRYRLYRYSNVSEYIHDNDNLRVYANIQQKSYLKLNTAGL